MEEEKGKKRVGVSGSCLGQPGAGEDQEQEHREHVTARGRQLTLVQGEVTPGSSSPVAAALLSSWSRHTNSDEGHGLALPGRLRIQPSLWSKDDVIHWLRWAEREYCLQQTDESKFEMNGKALCILTKDDFRFRAPGSGDVLYELLQYIKTQRRALRYSPLLKSPYREAKGTGEGLWKMSWDPPQCSMRFSLSGMDGGAEAAPTAPSPCLEHTELPPSHSLHQPLNLSHPSTEGSCGAESIRFFPTAPSASVDGKIADCRLLWDYIYQLLSDSRYEPYIKWEDKEAKLFRIVNPHGLAHLWGNHKNRMNMTYEKMSRALRHYYKLNIIKREPGQKLLFRFLKTPEEIIQEKSSKLEQLENMEHEELREELLEVSVQDTTEGCVCTAVQGDLCSAGKCQHLLLPAQKAAEGVLDSKSCLEPKL
ncbi:transcription factor ETV7 isoform X2 [Tympanuchus pallidicinctus]|uniref:transcription factor ETV7 isoform X2 n=1 Tax=Tympanuchus pallidicinctus TaxID=109042 RepID=UPI002286D8CA|nr:transcription factor ETV7 isoform X2 [Tympanuchus pallidicinctus]XP_052554430.1 transcription factor ETV7 isoform X2 [Tympanuchus pallidicinctus]